MVVLILILMIFIAFVVLLTVFPWLGNIIMNILWAFGAVERHIPDGRGGYWKFK